MPSAGFTLLELMVALVLLSLIFLLLTSGLQFGTNAWNAGEEEPSNSSEVVTAENFLRRILSETRPVIIEADSSHARHVFFIGKENSIRFVASVPGHLGIGGLYEVSIYFTEDEPGRIQMSWHLFRATETSSQPENEDKQVTLGTGVNQIQFAYFGYRGQNETARWYSDWQALDHLPDLIRMRVAFTDAHRIWPDLMVVPMVRAMDPIIDTEHLEQ
jgi:prepilin-type N-terminal cleavage/methylation domain-containing protein